MKMHFPSHNDNLRVVDRDSWTKFDENISTLDKEDNVMICRPASRKKNKLFKLNAIKWANEAYLLSKIRKVVK